MATPKIIAPKDFSAHFKAVTGMGRLRFELRTNRLKAPSSCPRSIAITSAAPKRYRKGTDINLDQSETDLYNLELDAIQYSLLKGIIVKPCDYSSGQIKICPESILEIAAIPAACLRITQTPQQLRPLAIN